MGDAVKPDWKASGGWQRLAKRSQDVRGSSGSRWVGKERSKACKDATSDWLLGFPYDASDWCVGGLASLIGQKREADPEGFFLIPPFCSRADWRKRKWMGRAGGGGEDGVPEPPAGIPADPTRQSSLYYCLRPHNRRCGKQLQHLFPTLRAGCDLV